jgi:hypothetical protein
MPEIPAPTINTSTWLTLIILTLDKIIAVYC